MLPGTAKLQDSRSNWKPLFRAQPERWERRRPACSGQGGGRPQRCIGAGLRLVYSPWKGRQHLARGVSPGAKRTGFKPWKGDSRTQKPRTFRLPVAPLGLGMRTARYPGLTPRARRHRPSGAEIRDSSILSSAFLALAKANVTAAFLSWPVDRWLQRR